LTNKLEKLRQDKTHSMIIQAVALKKRKLQDKEEVDKLSKKMKRLKD